MSEVKASFKCNSISTSFCQKRLEATYVCLKHEVPEVFFIVDEFNNNIVDEFTNNLVSNI